MAIQKGMIVKGDKHTEKTKKKIGKTAKKRGVGKWMKGRKHSEETKKKMRLAHLGKIYSFKNRKPISEETKIKIGLANKGKIRSSELKKRLSKIHTENPVKYWLGKSGKGLPNWRGGLTTENGKIRASIEYHLWREKVLKRDKFTCQKTKIEGGILCSHHIKNFAQYPKLRFKVSNGITLCKKMHDKFHNTYGRRNNTKEQLDKFLI
ncbi:MAG: hypothetical protein KAT66_00515 [Candidatus Lokiarchaeota archaeon]|nr:hypothetical protein [Candidatus Lokiarchaeota archaeon]